ncbi:MAG: hypothetical protein A2X61_11165 [Ignavibacteria bacterium GWB2_35_12]|nr:MAG: hypothetical protein A2X61_11165 [Ignavibacteria bacterium GWB2_35_12]OGU86622.1 MAG: hypothetical protein A2220_02510 [Ignavibacteria bacterium RIFOXYA2_FULL_35_10]OGV23996.1 MAG: hypothetical protein A2475_10810 [Ignavibacteria bacterium RIFOXYC2_FULL_35_21]
MKIENLDYQFLNENQFVKETSEKLKYYARLSFLRKQESGSGATLWIPAFEGMTYREYFSDVC